jgi:hypothetical protein
LVPLPDDIEDEITAGDGKEKSAAEKQAYMRYLFGVAQQTGTNLKSYLPSKLPTMDQMSMPKVSLPASMSNVSMPSVSMPSVSLFSKKPTAESGQSAQAQDAEKKEPELSVEGEKDVEPEAEVESK